MADQDSNTPPDIEHRTKPLSRGASKVLVVASILFIIGATIGGSYYLINVTSRALEAPADTTQQVAPAPDTSSAQP